jgi:hypothetical protein
MPPRKRRQRANGDPGGSDADAAGLGPSSLVAGLLDVLDAVLAHGRLCVGARHAVRVLCRRARDAVDSAIVSLDLAIAWVQGKLLLQEHRAALLRFFARLRGLRELKATLDAAMLVQLAASRSGMSAPVGPAPSSSLPSLSRRSSMGLRRMELHLPVDCTLGPWDLGAVLSAFPGLEVGVGPGGSPRPGEPWPAASSPGAPCHPAATSAHIYSHTHSPPPHPTPGWGSPSLPLLTHLSCDASIPGRQ